MSTATTYPSLVRELARELGGEVTPEQVRALSRYVELVAEWNRVTDLTGPGSGAELAEKLLADALVIRGPEIVPSGSRVVDVGSGAGTPVVPLLILRDDLSAVLVEPRRKRVAFLRTAIGTIDLVRRARVVEGRIDPANPSVEGEERFDVAMSRATFSPDVWVAVGVSLAGRTLVFTARARPPEPPDGARQSVSRAYRLPGTGAERRVTVYEG